MEKPLITVITPTKGGSQLFKLIDSLHVQGVPYRHLLLWDDKRDDKFLISDLNPSIMYPKDLEIHEEINNIVIKGSLIKGVAAGSALRAIGLMAANTQFVTFADDDVWFEKDHFKTLLKNIYDNNAKWGYSTRKIWNPNGEYIGVDLFESVGASSSRKVPYEMVDNNSMLFERKFGSFAAYLYRETVNYNDDRLMYSFLKQHAGQPAITSKSTVNQVCPHKLIGFFKRNCTMS